MLVDKNKKRLKAIKEVCPIFFARKCRCCGNEYIKEKMFSVDRWGVWTNRNRNFYEWNYCKHCMPTKEDVLTEIDTDRCIFGIAFVDEHTISKTDNTKCMNELLDAVGVLREIQSQKMGRENKIMLQNKNISTT